MTSLAPVSDAALSPAAQTLATVERGRRAHTVRLPARFAHAALRKLLAMHQARGEIIDGPRDASVLGRALLADQWALRLCPDVGAPLRFVGPSFALGAELVWVFPKHTVALAPSDAARLLRALEAVKPDELDASGRPLPWVPVRPRLQALGGRDEHDDDASEIDADTLEAAPASIDHPDLGRWLVALAGTAGLTVPALVVARAATDRLGFTTGRIWYDRAFTPLRVQLTLCPNADLAESLATLVHELAHPRARTHTHDLAFKTTLVDLCARHFGTRWFEGARAQLGRSYRIVDLWVASGIRAALRGGEAPVARTLRDDDGQLAKILMRIKKLRDLAADQVGLPEGIAATTAANDLITAYGLESYGVRIGEVTDQMVDLWVPLEAGAVWRRTLAHAVAAYCDVFSLAMSRGSRMHFFGRHADVVAAEYLYSVSADRIARECAEHIARWKRWRGTTTARTQSASAAAAGGDTRTEKTSFCDSATIAFKHKLEQLAEEEAPSARGDLESAESFAWSEHEKRGQSWGSGGRRTYRDNAAGRALGDAMEVLRGLDGAAAPPKALSHRG